MTTQKPSPSGSSLLAWCVVGVALFVTLGSCWGSLAQAWGNEYCLQNYVRDHPAIEYQRAIVEARVACERAGHLRRSYVLFATFVLGACSLAAYIVPRAGRWFGDEGTRVAARPEKPADSVSDGF